MKRILIVCLFISLGVASNSLGQEVVDIHTRYDHAKDLYERGAFKAARAEFDQAKQSPYRAETAYFIASCAVKSEQVDGEFLIQQFVADYPHHVFAQSAYLDMANHYFNHAKYEEALKNFNKSNASPSHEVLFKKGYAQFRLEKQDASLRTFKKLKGSFTDFEKDAAYFQGYIYHSREKYTEAFPYLELAFESKKFKKPAIELYSSTLYQKGDYKELIALVNEDMTPITSGIVLNYMADSYYATGQFKLAAGHYKELFRKYGKHRIDRNYYRAGYSSYSIDNTTDAIDYLKKSAVADDSVGAYASYYLGVIYDKNENLPFSITAFENTAKYETVLREDALYYQALGLMKVPNYQGAIEVLNQYTKDYKQGKYVSSVNEMLGTAYAYTNNYGLAIKYIEQLDRLTPQLKSTYQRVSFMKGVTLFNDKKFGLAVEVFQKSLIHDEDISITQQTYYWTGESLSILDNQSDAMFYYNSVGQSPDELIYIKSIYGKAYAEYNSQNYQGALLSFRKFEGMYTSKTNKNYLTDALLRIGDCNFALKHYQAGIDYYTKAEQSGSKKKGYIYFQIGLLNRYLDEDVTAKRYFRKLIKEVPTSSRQDHAQFQIAQIDFENGEAKKAIDGYTVLLTKYPSSSFVPFALLSQAVAFDNLSKVGSCIANYKEILNRFPRHQSANSALLGLQDKHANDQFDQFDEYLEKYKSANPNSEALENIEYETARTNYYSQKYELAIRGFQDFAKAYPSSSLVPDANYFIGDSYFRRGQLDEALDYFSRVEQLIDYSKHAKVLYRIATIQSEKGNLRVGNDYYFKLKNASNSSRNKINVENGLMENYYDMSHYDSAIYYGNSLLDNPRAGVLISANANLIIGKSEYENDFLEEALINFLPLVSNSPDERGAEAYYYISKIYHEQEQFEKALESLFVLTNNFKTYEVWVAKAYLLMAEIYIETDEIFQAKATLNSLIEHAAIPEIQEQAENRLNELDESIDANED